MVPMPCHETWTPTQQAQLLGLALQSIRHGMDYGRAFKPSLNQYPAELQAKAATFVTLHLNHRLRGCIGHLEAAAPLVTDIANNAFAAAFEDPRFQPLKAQEFEGLAIHISILSQPEALSVATESALLAGLRPGIDGLILAEGQLRATFLPSVWEQLPDAQDFVRALKRKAGMPQDYWSDRILPFRYQTQSFGRPVTEITTI